MLGDRVLGLDYSFLRGALSPPTTHPGGLTQSAPVPTVEDPQHPFKPGDPPPTQAGKLIFRRYKNPYGGEGLAKVGSFSGRRLPTGGESP